MVVGSPNGEHQVKLLPLKSVHGISHGLDMCVALQLQCVVCGVCGGDGVHESYILG